MGKRRASEEWAARDLEEYLEERLVLEMTKYPSEELCFDSGEESSDDADQHVVCHPRSLLIFDWDDTLLPSTWIQRQGLQLANFAPTPEQRRLLLLVAKGASKILALAKRLSTVVIVTNAERGRVELSCKTFMPLVLPLLEGVRIVSARSKYEPQGVRSPFQWKRLAFEHEVECFCGQSDDAEQQRSIISLGDSGHEREALLVSTENRNTCYSKSVKFAERPQVTQLMSQLELAKVCLKHVAEHKGNLDLCLRLSD